MTVPKTLYFVRHGQTEWNAIGRFQGQFESRLSKLGRDQAEENGRLLSKLGVDRMVASPLTRTLQTAEIIKEILGLGFDVDDRLKEWDCGEWSGFLLEEVKHKWPDEWGAFEADRFNYRGPGCENFPDMIARSDPFVESLLDWPEQKIAIVSHGMIGRAIFSRLLGLTEEAIARLRQPNEMIIHVVCGPGTAHADHFIDGDGPFEGAGEIFSI